MNKAKQIKIIKKHIRRIRKILGLRLCSDNDIVEVALKNDIERMKRRRGL